MRNQSGLSLVELMISITLGLLLMAGVTQMFVSSKTTFGTQQGMSRIQETGRLALEFINRDLRMASYFGCVRTKNPAKAGAYNITDSSGVSTGLHGSFTQGLVGYVNVAALPHSLATDLGSVTPVPTATGTDILVIRGANERGFPLTAANTATQVKGYTTATATETINGNTCVEGICVNGVAVVADCSNGTVFKVSALALGSNIVTANASTTLTANQYSRGDLLPVHTTVYFLAKSTDTLESSLWQKVDTQPPVELLQGIEDWRLTYSTDLVTYKRANNVTNWDDVKSINIELLIRGADSNSLADKQTYTFGGVTTQATDKRIRQVFSTNLSVRTRFNGLGL